ncbi:MAG: SagB/ThcOx family dehydrogenase [Candidatus Cloacimonetes bacterium]|jgi:SagB-type dehydrogenase family enzyme|nr:SagB/ThcOx family dehydrogenase [Candidatus Cloacimonadota bacterium]MDD2505999.1 SagB/ThcOx family dehydrogenase [Candidatus Cloacimonadota bacterium]MDD4559246.1 SagB/ThcOx family dehydrogenase [Candidatus Cloacimonadota bacterium]
MDSKTFDYLYYKTHGYTHEQICKESGMSTEELEVMESALRPVLAEIELDRPKAKNIGQDFVKLTRYVYAVQSDQQLGIPRPDAIKARSGELFALPAVGTLDFKDKSLQDMISQRRSLREYSEEPLSMEELSFLLYCSSWARDFRSNERMEITFRNVPSAGSRHPIECFLDVHRVSGIKNGLYYYHPIKHCLILMEEGAEVHQKIFEGCLRQEMVSKAAVNFILSAVPYRTSWRYGQRGYRYLYLDAGHIGQNLHLAAEAIGAGCCMIGAYLDEGLNSALNLDGFEEFVIYVAALGKKK